MGALRQFDLGKYPGVTTFVETGTQHGDSLSYALAHGYDKLYSIELLEKHYTHCVERFKDDANVILLLDNSVDGLDTITKMINEPTLYWLDAHLPNFNDDRYTNNYAENADILIPLETELETIKRNKDISKDVFIIDDLRIYENGNFESGNWGDVISSTKYTNGIDFVYRILSDTHDISRDMRDEGYVICTPKK